MFLHSAPKVLTFSLLLLLMAGCTRPAPPPTKPDTPPPPRLRNEPAQSPLHTLYEDTWNGWDIRLFALDLRGQRAWVWKSFQNKEDIRLVLDEVDLRHGKLLSSLLATPQNARLILRGYPIFRPWNGTLESDLPKMASILSASGPWSTRPRTLAPALAVSPSGDQIVYEGAPTNKRDGDWLYLYQRGAAPRRIGPSLRASYSPRFSPQGDRLAWRACSPDFASRGSKCGYRIALASSDALDQKPHLIASLPNPSSPIWSPEGDTLYSVSRTRQKTCLFAVDVQSNAKTSLHELLCSAGEKTWSFLQSENGTYGVLVDLENQSITGLNLKTRRVYRQVSTPEIAGAGALRNDGTLVAPRRAGGVVVLDLKQGKPQYPKAFQGRFKGFESAQWTQDGHVILLQTFKGGFKIVELSL